MKQQSFPLVLLSCLIAPAGMVQAAVRVVRPAIENRHSPNPALRDVSAILSNARISPPASAPSSGGKHLVESTIGQPFATYVSPHQTFAAEKLAAVYGALYPPGYPNVTANAATIRAGSAAFRYKYLVYGADPNDAGATPPIINQFEQLSGNETLFTDADRDKARAQILVLRDALAFDPLNENLQLALLEIHYDWAVAETLQARQSLARLATYRLGMLALSPPQKFIIDAEIDTYKTLVEVSGRVVDIYRDLLSYTEDGIDPSDYDSTAGGAPLGFYLFKTLSPKRNQTPSQYADATGIKEVINPGSADYNAASFTGYKDYRTLLTLLGQNIEYQTELSRLLGVRRNTATADTTEARKGLTAARERAAITTLLGRMFTGVTFADSTGIEPARLRIAAAIEGTSGVTSFLNGFSNHLGLDPDFLILLPSDDTVPSGTNVFDSYDILASRIVREDPPGTPVGPLAIAKTLLGNPNNPATGGGAVQAYTNFRANVTSVVNEQYDVNINYEEKIRELTGYEPDDVPGFDGFNPKPNTPSELSTLNRELTNLSSRNLKLTELTMKLADDAADAQKAVTLARSIEGTITGAQATYLDKTSSAWTEIHSWAGAAAAAQATYDGFKDVAQVDAGTEFFTGGSVGVAVAVAGAANLVVQTAAATRTSMRQQEIDEAAVALDIKIATAGLPLTIQQQILELNALYREALSNKLEVQDNMAAYAQVLANKTALLRTVSQLTKKYRAALDSLAKSYYADPIFYIRAENALLEADDAFREAQRWMFYTCRALEYKWQQKFVTSANNLTYDISSILKARNATELETIRQQMALFNNTRTGGAGASQPSLTVISLRDQFLSANPAGSAETDAGWRAANPLQGGGSLTKVQEFRKRLADSNLDTAGNIVIDFDTSTLQNFSGDFFTAPDFSGAVPQSGNYRDKIMWTAVHLLTDTGAASPQVSTINGALSYGGITYFRTRIPVRPATRTNATTTDPSLAFNIAVDFPGEYIVAPVRYYQDTNLTGSFTLFENSVSGHQFAESRTSAKDLAGNTLAVISNPSFGFRRGTFKERAVAATRMVLQINKGNNPTLTNLINRLQDIEIVIQHQSYPRPRVQ